MSEQTAAALRTRYRTGDPGVDQALLDLLDELGAIENRDQLFEILELPSASPTTMPTASTSRSPTPP